MQCTRGYQPLFWFAVSCVPLLVLIRCFLNAPIDPVAIYSCESKNNYRVPFALSVLYLVIMRGEILNNEAKTMTSQTVGLL